MLAYQKMTQLYAPTLKEDPNEAELPSHKLMLRAGMIRKSASGLYSYLPLAWRSLQKIEAIIREEMERVGAQEALFPILIPAELWHESGRWGAYGDELMRVEDRHGREFCLGPTHEESVTDLVRDELRSYKQLPVTLYQIQTKFRDELRPRFGLMRGREFIMKDAYSFSEDEQSLQEIYDNMKVAYANVCERCGIKALQVVADTGEIGGNASVEFMALADSGEASLVWCECGYAADDEAATAAIVVKDAPAQEMEFISTPGVSNMEDAARACGVEISQTRKALALVDEEGNAVVAMLPGDHDLNEIKAHKVLGNYHAMTDEELSAYGLYKGSIGPVNLPENIRLIADISLQDSSSWVCGANQKDTHIIGACMHRDFEIEEFFDLAQAKAGDICPTCGKPLQAARGIEVSQVFQLGTKYSEAMGATFMDKNGSEKPLVMGCYGIGVSRTLAAIVEQHFDEDGIIFPVSVAPYHIEIILLSLDEDLMQEADRIATELIAQGVEVLVDDRKERPGVKFADADLMGVPYQIVLGKRSFEQGQCEYKIRATKEKTDIALGDVVSVVVDALNA